jgi:hypothetical protein
LIAEDVMAVTRAPRPNLAEVAGTRELLQLVVQKLASQILLFSVAAIVFILAAFFIFAEQGLIVAIFVTIIFVLGAAGYLFVEERKNVEEGQPEAVANLLAHRLDSIYHDTPADGALRVTVAAKRRPIAGPRDIGIEPHPGRAAFHIGDDVEILVEASRDCYLTLLNVGTSGKLTILYPNSLHPDSFLPGGRPHVIPGSEYGFRYVLKGPIGTERLKAIATSEPVPFLESSFAPDGSLFKQIEATAAARDIAIVKERTEELAPDAWAEDSFEFDVKP